MSTRTWTVADAKAKLSEVLENAEAEGPQRITLHGRTTAVVVAAKESRHKSNRTVNLAEFFAASPLCGAGVNAGRLNLRLKVPVSRA